MSDDQVVVFVNGVTYSGWKAVSITRSIEALASSFSISLTDIWSPNQEAWPIVPGDAISIELGGKKVLTGFVDDVSPDEQSNVRNLKITGRDKLMDIVDCSENITPGQLKNVTALQIAQRMVRSFGINVRADVSVGEKFLKFAIQPGETAFNTISRAALKRSLLMISADAGETLLLTQAGKSRATDALVLGVNIKGLSAIHSMKQRYSEYIVKGQSNQIAGVWEGTNASQMKAVSNDAGVSRFRPKTIIESGDFSAFELKRRADYEAAVRAGKGTRSTIVMNGWRQTDGELWPINALTAVNAQSGIQIDQDMLMSGVNYTLENGGGKTAISVIRPGAYTPAPPKKENEVLPQLGTR